MVAAGGGAGDRAAAKVREDVCWPGADANEGWPGAIKREAWDPPGFSGDKGRKLEWEAGAAAEACDVACAQWNFRTTSPKIRKRVSRERGALIFLLTFSIKGKSKSPVGDTGLVPVGQNKTTKKGTRKGCPYGSSTRF